MEGKRASDYVGTKEEIPVLLAEYTATRQELLNRHSFLGQTLGWFATTFIFIYRVDVHLSTYFARDCDVDLVGNSGASDY